MTAPAAPAARTTLVRGLGGRGTTLLAIGSMIGTGIFLAPSDMARALPNAGGVLLACVASGFLTIAGALTYAELGTLFPQAGGPYRFLKEAYGPLWGFLYGWTAFLVIMSGGIAAIAVGFARYLGGFVPWFSSDHVLSTLHLGVSLSVTGDRVAAVLAILVLTAVNHFGLRAGARVQQALVVLNVAAILVLVTFGIGAGRGAGPDIARPLPAGALAGFGAAMVAMLWTFDGWYGPTFSTGELRDPARHLPRGLVSGACIVTVLYVALLVVYLRALPLEDLARSPRVAEAAAQSLFGPGAGRAVAAMILVSSLGCLASTILYSSRIYAPMASDGLFFASLMRLHPRWRVPVRSLWSQSAWAALLALSGTYAQLYTFVVTAVVLFHAATAIAVFVLRRRRPDLPRPYRVRAYPWTPLAFLCGCSLLLAGAVRETPIESIAGLGIVALGFPVYLLWLRRATASRTPVQART